jgi:hypothetical protein
MSISAMKQALEALENTYAYLPRRWGGEVEADQAITALRQAIAEAEQPDLARVGEVGVWGDKREWVGLDGDIPGLGLVTEEFYNGMLCAEDILRKRNT